MNHYTYLLEFPNGMKYVGVRSTHLEPVLDTCYLGSGRALPERSPSSCTKTILEQFPTREQAVQAEYEYLVKHGCCESDEYYNVRLKNYDKHGLTAADCPGIARSGTFHKGRKWNMSLDSANLLRGDSRTPAQKAGAIKMRQALTGVKNPKKGLPGIVNNGFIPWYYISPTREYVEVYDQTKEDLAASLGFTRRQLIHGFHHSNIHQKARTLPRKGWTFGNLPRPTPSDDV